MVCVLFNYIFESPFNQHFLYLLAHQSYCFVVVEHATPTRSHLIFCLPKAHTVRQCSEWEECCQPIS